MESVISNCCNAFTINKGKFIECSNCHKVIAEVAEEDDIVIGITYNDDPDIMSTVDTSSTTIRIAKRLATDQTCMLVDNKICPKCKSKCRFTRAGGVPVYVCSNGNCREIIE